MVYARLGGNTSGDWRWPVAGALAVFQAVFIWWLLAQPAGEDATVWFDDISVAIAPMVAGLVSLAVVARYWGSKSALAWGLIACGLFLFAFGDTTWAIQELAMGKEVPFPSVSDAGYLGGYVPVLLGLLLMPQAPAAGLRRLTLTLDVLVGIVAVGLVSWNFVIGRVLVDSSGSWLAQAISVAYPLSDLAVVFGVMVLLARATPGRSTSSLLLLGAAFAATAFSDSLYIYLSAIGKYATGSYIDIGWLAGYNLVTLSALLWLGPRPHPDPRQRTEEHPASIWQTAGLYAIAAPMCVLLLFGSGVLITAGVLGIVALTFGRQLVTLHENLTLNRRLEQLTAELEIKVKKQTLELLSRRGPPEKTVEA
ncbi:MAG: hypothetical protein Q7T33_11410 [Dehalococcoidia bacterium]|nr:hypothetical protein [Dehalococcoidia bacterium]